jgi:general secretion pathway protein G
MYASKRKCLERAMKGEKGKQMLETIKGREAHRRKGDEGFTLIELLVVIVILAILAAIVVFAVGGIGDKGQASACDTDLKTIQTAQEAYFANVKPTGQYAASTDALKTGGFLTESSTLHTTRVDPADGSYFVEATPTGGCDPAKNYHSAAPK